MDPTEDLSARVLLRHILSTEPPRTPVTRSASKAQRSSGTRRSKRYAGAPTPQDILRRSMRHKMHESITRKSLPTATRRKTNTPAPALMLFDEEDTPRHILRNILRTEPVKSPVVHERAASEEPQPPSANSTITTTLLRSELSGLELPDLTIGNAASTAKGLRRKRPRRSLNVTAFEKRLKVGNDGETENENEESRGDHSSLSLSSSTSLSLKTPFVEAHTEKKGLQRRVSNRRKITEEQFGAAVNKRQTQGVSSFARVQQGLTETAYSEGFTLGLSKLSEPDVTTDIVNCNTALYAQSDAMVSSFSIVATQDKPTVMASQIQRQMNMTTQEEKSKLWKEKSIYAFPVEERFMVGPENDKCFLQLEEDSDVAESQKEERKSTIGGQPEDITSTSKSEKNIAESLTSIRHDTLESEEEENQVEMQTEEEPPQTEGESVAGSQSEEEAAADSQTEEDDAVDSQTEQDNGEIDFQPDKDVAAMSQSDSEEADFVPDSQIGEDDAAESETGEDDAAESETGEDDEAESQTGEDDAAESHIGEDDSGKSETGEDDAAESQTGEDDAAESQTGEDDAAESQTGEESAVDSQEDVETRSQSEEKGDVAGSQTEDEYEEKQEGEKGGKGSEELEPDMEHIIRRARHSEAQLIMSAAQEGGDLAETTEAGWSGGKSKAHSAVDQHSSLEMGSHESTNPRTKISDCHLEEVHDTENDGRLNDASPEEAASQDAAEQEDVWEDEDEDESEDFPCKTPAFVREKRNFLHTDPVPSMPVLSNIQASGTSEALPAKSKQVRWGKRGPSKKEPGLTKSYVMGVFKHFAKMKVSGDVYPVLKETLDKFFDRLAEDLETYAHHAKRNTIEVEDAILLLKRQGYVNDKVPVEVLIEKYLRLDQRRLLIPIATSGNVVIPKKRR